MDVSRLDKDSRLEQHGSGQRILALVGLATPIIFGCLFIVAGLLRPGYNPIRQYGSELEAGPLGWLQRGNFILVGSLLIVLAYNLHRGIANGPGWYLGPALIAIAGMALALVGFYPSGTWHYRGFKLFAYASIAAFVVLTPRLRRDTRWRPFAPWSVIAAVLALILWLAYVWGANPTSPLNSSIGLVQRLFLGVLFGWLAVLAARRLSLLVRGGAPRASRPYGDGQTHGTVAP